MTDKRDTDFVGAITETGALRFEPECGQSFVGLDGKTYLRSGIVSSSIGSYPVAANFEKLKVSGVPTALVSAANFTQIADNGAGTIIAAHNDATNAQSIYRSTNGGTSWTAISIGWGGSVRASAIVWTGNRFMVAGCDTNAIYSANSVAGTSWAINTVGATAANLEAGSVRGAWDGTRCYFAAKSTSAPASGSVINLNDSATPTTTSRTAPNAFPNIPNVFADGSTIIADNFSTTDGGANYTTRTFPVDTTYQTNKIGSNYVTVSDFGIYTSTDLNAWTLVYSPSTILKCGKVSKSGSNLYISLYASDGSRAVIWTSNGTTFTLRQLSTGSGHANIDWIFCVSGTIAFPSARLTNTNTGSNILKVASWTTPDYVGVNRAIYQDATNAGTSSTVAYVGLS